jgi:hypothetical protein
MKPDQASIDSERPASDGIADLVAEHYAAQAAEVCKDRDGHWGIVQRWSYGDYVGWFIEHHGYLYELPDGQYGEEGPFPSYEAALGRLADHLRAASDDLQPRRND